MVWKEGGRKEGRKERRRKVKGSGTVWFERYRYLDLSHLLNNCRSLSLSFSVSFFLSLSMSLLYYSLFHSLLCLSSSVITYFSSF